MPFISSVEGTFGQGRANQSQVEFDYPNFSSTAGLTEVSTAGVIGNALQLTTATTNDVGNVQRSTAIQQNRSFSFQWNFECSGGTSPPADGYCLQWTPTNNTNGFGGGGVGLLSTAVQAFTFQTQTNNQFQWQKNNVIQTTVGSQNYVGNFFYWADYDNAAQTMKIQISSTSTKPALANQSLTGFSFSSTSQQIGFGAATGGATENHILRSMKLTFI